MDIEKTKVLVVDDSSMASDLTVKQLTEAGYEAQGLNDPAAVVERLAEWQPDYLICDVMMPEINGFEVVQKIRADDRFADLRIVMSSAKAYDADQQKARRLGANGYIIKPFSMEKFNPIVDSFGTMKLTAWGVRGTLPMPQEGFIKYGGHTSCYSLEFPHDHFLVFDSGSGIHTLGSELMKAGKSRISADLFITHPHWDHINAFPFFTPLYIPGNTVRVRGSAQDSMGFEQLMLAQMDGTYFPVTAREFGAQVTFEEIGEQDLDLDGISVKSIMLKHPGHCLGYRVDYHGRSFCYITDNELYPAKSEFADEEFVEKLADFCRGTNILVHDCTYFDEEYESKVHWGHSPLSEVCRLAHLAEAEKLWIHHHDPSQNDEAIARKLDVCSFALMQLGSSTEAVLPSERMSVTV